MSASGTPPQQIATATSVDGFAAPVAHTLRPNLVPRLNRPKTLWERMDALASRLSTRNNFWQKLCSLIWLPYAFHSGIRMKKVDANTFIAVLPFRRFNRNWYNAMAGAALLGNTEIAAGFYIFGFCGADYTVVCKNLNYRFLRPCLGPAIYRIRPKQDIKPLLETQGEFNLDLEVDILQMNLENRKVRYLPLRLPMPVELSGKERRVGRCEVTFHVTPKAQHAAKADRIAGRMQKPAPGSTPGSAPAPGTAPGTAPAPGSEAPGSQAPVDPTAKV
jgi:hypothetical protein